MAIFSSYVSHYHSVSKMVWSDSPDPQRLPQVLSLDPRRSRMEITLPVLPRWDVWVSGRGNVWKCEAVGYKPQISHIFLEISPWIKGPSIGGQLTELRAFYSIPLEVLCRINPYRWHVSCRSLRFEWKSDPNTCRTVDILQGHSHSRDSNGAARGDDGDGNGGTVEKREFTSQHGTWDGFHMF